jgi:hypothetical protein
MVWWMCLPSFVDFWTQLALVLIWFCSGFALVLVWDLAKIDGIPTEFGGTHPRFLFQFHTCGSMDSEIGHAAIALVSIFGAVAIEPFIFDY